jgi:hypothetical protein
MQLEPDHVRYLQEEFKNVEHRWGRLQEQLHGYPPARRTRPVLEFLSKWSAKVVKGFSLESFPYYALEPVVSTEEQPSLIRELTGVDDDRQAGLRIILWTALYEAPDLVSSKYSEENNPFGPRVSEWFDGLFESDGEQVVALKEPIAWVRSALLGLITEHSQPLIAFDKNKSLIVIQGKGFPISSAELDVLQALHEYGKDGLTKDQLDRLSGHTEARKILRKAVNKHPELEKFVIFPETNSAGGYKLKS